MTIFLIASICLIVGLVAGIFGTMVSMSNADSTLIDNIELNSLTLSNFEGRWGVFQTVEGKQLMVGQSHETARGAMAAAGSVTRG